MIGKQIELSSEFKLSTSKAIFAIILFFIVYLLLFLFSLGITALCIYGGYLLIVNYPRIITIILGVGLASLGIIVSFFLVKFIFKSNKTDLSHLHEIRENEEPVLFQMIKDIVNEVGTSFPKKIYLSSDVNAAVFYDSSFWSMFLPVKKNLQIGMGLVVSVTQEELKAILAHEFGHFSQRTMKVGSYVYNVNQVIYNMLFDNEAYDNAVGRWASASGYFAIFVLIAVKIIDGIKWILQQMYGLVNKSYMALSREMEFHADEIAAHVTGFEPLRDSLLRLNFAENTYSTVLSFYDGKIKENLKSDNIYKEQSHLLQFLGKEDELSFKNNLPSVQLDDLNKFNKSKLVIEDQWASHPTTEERIKRLEKTGINTQTPSEKPAIDIFKQAENLQKKLTEILFQQVSYAGEVKLLSFNNFVKEFEREFQKNSFSKIYNGYYDHKNPTFFKVDEIKPALADRELSQLFSDNMINLVYESIALQGDIDILKQIDSKTLKLKSFDYNGVKYNRKKVKELLPQLQSELSAINESILQNDMRIYQFFLSLEDKQTGSGDLRSLYHNYFEFDQQYDSKIAVYDELQNALQFLNYTTPYEQIEANFRQLKLLEKSFKDHIKELLESGKFDTEMTEEIKSNFELYLSEDWIYFSNENYRDKNLEVLFIALNNYFYLLSRGYFLHKKMLLDYQGQLNTMQKAAKI